MRNLLITAALLSSACTSPDERTPCVEYTATICAQYRECEGDEGWEDCWEATEAQCEASDAPMTYRRADECFDELSRATCDSPVPTACELD